MSALRLWTRTALLLALVAVVVVPAAARDKLDAPLSQLAENTSAMGSIRVIVQTNEAPIPEECAEVRALGGQAGEPFVSINGFPAVVPVAGLVELASQPWVAGISADMRMTPALDRAAAATEVAGPRDGLDLTGSGVRVALIDSGIADHPDLPAVVLRRSFTGEEPGTDPYGHGTAVASAIAGTGAASGVMNSTRRFVGMAPDAELISLKVVDRRGFCPASRVIRALDWCLANQAREQIKVVCLPLTHPVTESYTTDPLTQACARLWENGILVVTAAGNEGPQPGSVQSPGNDPRLLTVGAANADCVATSSYTGVGPSRVDGVEKPDILAPGTALIVARSADMLDSSPANAAAPLAPSAYIVGPQASGPVCYETARGSSLSAGIVAGIAALMIQDEPELTPDTIKLRLVATATAVGEGARATLGLANASAALASDVNAECPALSSEAQGDAGFQPVDAQDAKTNLIWDPQDGEPDPDDTSAADPSAGEPPPDDGTTGDTSAADPSAGDPPPDDGTTSDTSAADPSDGEPPPP